MNVYVWIILLLNLIILGFSIISLSDYTRDTSKEFILIEIIGALVIFAMVLAHFTLPLMSLVSFGITVLGSSVLFSLRKLTDRTY